MKYDKEQVTLREVVGQERLMLWRGEAGAAHTCRSEPLRNIMLYLFNGIGLGLTWICLQTTQKHNEGGVGFCNARKDLSLVTVLCCATDGFLQRMVMAITGKGTVFQLMR